MMRVTVDPQELMNVAALLATSAVELADIGSTLRACTGCEMPPGVRSSVDSVVATADRLFDDMAVGLRGEAADLVRRAIVAAIDMDLASGLTVDQIRAQVGLPPLAVATPVGGTNWSTIASPASLPSGGGGTYSLAGAMQNSQERQQKLFAKLSASGANTSSGSFPMPGSMSLSSLPTSYNPWTTMSMSDIRNKVGGSPSAADIKYYNPGLARSRGYS
jgi:hypothetical protein